MEYELFIGLRYLKAKRWPFFVSFITLISIGGVALGVMALIVVLAVMSGFEHDLQRKFLGTDGHLWILKYGDGGIEDWEAVLEKVRGVKTVEAASPFTFAQAMLASEGRAIGAVVRGIDIRSVGDVTDLKRHLKAVDEGRLSFSGQDGPRFDDEGIILGKVLATYLGVGLGSLVNVISPLAADPTPLGMAPRMRAFRVVGLFEVGMYEYDSSLAYISIPAAQRFFRMGSAVTGIEAKLSNIFKAEGAALLIRDRLGFPYFTRTWMEMHRNLFLAIKKEKVLMFIILAMILLVAAFGIAGNLIMTVMQKQKEIGILKAMGATSSSIMRIFMAKGLIVGVAGTILGLIGGFSFIVNLDRLSAFLERLLGFEMFPSDVYFLDKLPYQVNPLDVGATVVMAILVSVLATLYPSWRAAKLDPIAAIRYE